MAKKKIRTDGHGQGLHTPNLYKKKPPAKWVEGRGSRSVRLNRERLFWKLYPEQREQIEDYVKHMKNEWENQDK